MTKVTKNFYLEPYQDKWIREHPEINIQVYVRKAIDDLIKRTK